MVATENSSREIRRCFLFILVAYVFTWFFWIPDALNKMGLIPVSPLTGLGFIGAFGPLVSAIIVTSVYEGKDGVKNLFKKVLDHRFKKRWWLPVFFLMPALVLVAFAIAVLTDGIVPPLEALSQPAILVPAFFSVLLLSGPFEEEFGWRGYALPRLQARFNPHVSSVVLGMVWAAWHLPQFIIPGNGMFYKTPLWTFFPTVVAATFLFTWIYNNTNGSMMTSLLFHTTFNFSMFVFPVLDTNFGYVYVLVIFVVAAALVTAFSGSLKTRKINVQQ
nr:type II CAAX endopeptidase family protein [Candidatus Sigynarchaeum springense]